jgi:hypothetical protein
MRTAGLFVLVFAIGVVGSWPVKAHAGWPLKLVVAACGAAVVTLIVIILRLAPKSRTGRLLGRWFPDEE